MKNLKGGVVVLVFAALFAAITLRAGAQNVSETQSAEGYTVTLKMLPPEAFSGPHAMMERESGAKPNDLVSPSHPNHHLVVFITKDGQPVTDATVEIRYRHIRPSGPAWRNLPVVRMMEKGKGAETTHYGNNLNLNSGTYEVHVIINNGAPITFHLNVKNAT